VQPAVSAVAFKARRESGFLMSLHEDCLNQSAVRASSRGPALNNNCTVDIGKQIILHTDAVHGGNYGLVFYAYNQS